MMARAASPATLTTIILLSAWIGASLVVAFVVAPAAFAVLPSRSLAGALVGRVLPVVFWAGIVLGAIVAVSSSLDGARRVPLVAGVCIIVACAASQLIVEPRIAALRSEIGVALDTLAPTDPRRATFGRLHGASVLGLGVGLIAAAVAVMSLSRTVASADRAGVVPSHEKTTSWPS